MRGRDTGTKKDFEALKRVLDSVNERVRYLEKENKRIATANRLLLIEKAQWIQARETQQRIIHKQITASNEENNRSLEEIQRLRAIIKELGGEA